MRLKLTWEQVAAATGGSVVRGRPDAPFNSFSTDTRRLAEDQALWALVGARFDAHDFLEQAPPAAGWVVRRNRGLPAKTPAQVLEVADTTEALARLATYHRRRFTIPLIGITGSNGKTTVKDMTAAILARRGPTAATAGNFNNEIGLPLSLLELTAEHRYGVFEMGASKPGDIAVLAQIAEPTLGILTNVGPAHLERLGDLRGVFKTKAQLVDGLPADAPVVLNADDEWLVQLLPRIGDRAVTFGRGRGAHARIVEQTADGKVTLSLNGERLSAAMHAPPGTGALNAAAAAGAAHALGFTLDEIRAGLEAYRPAALRGACARAKSGAKLILDCYNANPASMRAGITDFLDVSAGKERVLVLGDMEELGKDERRFHAELGAWLKDKKLAAVLLAGPKMAAAAEALAGASFPVAHADDPAGLAAALHKAAGKGVWVYFKASRKLALEKLAENL